MHRNQRPALLNIEGPGLVRQKDCAHVALRAGLVAGLRLGLSELANTTVVARWPRRWFGRFGLGGPERLRSLGGEVPGKLLDLTFLFRRAHHVRVKLHGVADPLQMSFGLFSALLEENLLEGSLGHYRVNDLAIHRSGCSTERRPGNGLPGLGGLHLQNRLTGYLHPVGQLLSTHAQRLANRPYPTIRWWCCGGKFTQYTESILQLPQLNSAKSFCHIRIEAGRIDSGCRRYDERKNILSLMTPSDKNLLVVSVHGANAVVRPGKAYLAGTRAAKNTPKQARCHFETSTSLIWNSQRQTSGRPTQTATACHLRT